MRRRKMSGRQSRKNFKKGNGISSRNSLRPMRGGIRI